MTEASLACGEVPEVTGGAACYRLEALPAGLPGTVPVSGARYSGFWWCFRNFRAHAAAAGGGAAVTAAAAAHCGAWWDTDGTQREAQVKKRGPSPDFFEGSNVQNSAGCHIKVEKVHVYDSEP